jgi:hypothetical protein
MRYKEIVGGNFHVIFDGDKRWSRFLTWLYPQLRSIGLTYGDSAMFVRRETYEKIKGFSRCRFSKTLIYTNDCKKRSVRAQQSGSYDIFPPIRKSLVHLDVSALVNFSKSLLGRFPAATSGKRL